MKNQTNESGNVCIDGSTSQSNAKKSTINKKRYNNSSVPSFLFGKSTSGDAMFGNTTPNNVGFGKFEKHDNDTTKKDTFIKTEPKKQTYFTDDASVKLFNSFNKSPFGQSCYQSKISKFNTDILKLDKIKKHVDKKIASINEEIADITRRNKELIDIHINDRTKLFLRIADVNKKREELLTNIKMTEIEELYSDEERNEKQRLALDNKRKRFTLSDMENYKKLKKSK